MTKYEQFFAELYRYRNTSVIITTKRLYDICRGIGLKSKATFVNYKRQCICKGILEPTSKKNTYKIDGKSLAYEIQYGNHRKQYNDMNAVIKALSRFKGRMFRSLREIRDFLYHHILGTTSMVSADTVSKQLKASGYITYGHDAYGDTVYIIGNNTDSPMEHTHTNGQKRERILEKLKGYTEEVPKWVIAMRLWKEGVFVSMASIYNHCRSFRSLKK